MERMSLDNEDQVLEAILSLDKTEIIFMQIDKNMANDLRYVGFKKDGLQNAVMSYINETHEMANVINFEKFVDRVAQLTVEKNSLEEQILLQYAGEKALRYLTSNQSNHKYQIDAQNCVLSIQLKNTPTAQSHMGICVH